MIEYVAPPFVHIGMLAYVNVKIENGELTDGNNSKIIVEVLSIRSDKNMVEICNLADQTCFWIPIDRLLVKIDSARCWLVPIEGNFLTLVQSMF